jgi:RimJ/RimL family protein N-acetyltransferase
VSPADVITFRRLTRDDLPTVHRWLNNPAVAGWYGLTLANEREPSLDAVIEHYLPSIAGETPTHPYIMLVDGVPFGYIQAYRIGDYERYAATLALDDSDSVGIDIFIGEDEHRDRGLGAAAIRRFLADEVFQRANVSTAIIAPEPDNKRGIRAYEKVGFRHVKTVFVEESGEHEYVMALSRAEFEALR